MKQTSAFASALVLLPMLCACLPPQRPVPSGRLPDARAAAVPSLPTKVAWPRQGIRGIYVSQATMRSRRLPALLRFMRGAGLNTLVVDVKNDQGTVALDGRAASMVIDMKRRHVYLIARIVTFKDAALARRHPELTIRRRGGGAWTQKGVAWVDPYRTAVWDYNVRIAQRALRVGFDEIQWDYVRFPDAPARLRQTAVFANPSGLSKSDDIVRFLQYAKHRLPNARISADVFGLVTTARDDMGIGQVWEKISPNVDAISPMMYPSHYGPGIYGLKNPERQPYRTVVAGLLDARARNARLRRRGLPTAEIRPWLQDFDMRVPYGRREVLSQVAAARALGVHQYLLWNQANVYSEDAAGR